jgi:DNA repair protein RadC
MKLDSSGHRKRLREKYSRNGHDSFQDYEKIELLLTYALPRVDVKPLAKELLHHFGGIAGLLDASRDELLQISGIGENLVNLIMLVRNLGADALKERLVKKTVIHCTADVIRYLKLKFAGCRKEAFFVIYLNTRNEVLDSGFFTEGTVDQVFLHARELFAESLRKNARAIILVHNHPGGSAEPSLDDKRLTEDLKNLGSSMRIDLLEHLIITHDAAFGIVHNQRVEIGEEHLFSFTEPLQSAAETEKKKFSRLPFQPKQLKNSMTVLTQKKSPGEKS